MNKSTTHFVIATNVRSSEIYFPHNYHSQFLWPSKFVVRPITYLEKNLWDLLQGEDNLWEYLL
jgi:hypothetical protein